MSPVGSPVCPYCENDVVLELPMPFGLVTCANCGERAWFLTVHSERAFFRYEAARFVAQLFHGLPQNQRVPKSLGFDDLDMVEVIASFEAELEEAT